MTRVQIHSCEFTVSMQSVQSINKILLVNEDRTALQLLLLPCTLQFDFRRTESFCDIHFLFCFFFSKV